VCHAHKITEDMNLIKIDLLQMVALLAAGFILGLMYSKWVILKKSKNEPDATPDQIPNPEETRRQWLVPNEHTEEIWKLWTKWEKEGDHTAKWQVWRKIIEIFPEVGETVCHLEEAYPSRILVVEGEKETDNESE
jgi:hypothetical protein